MPAALFLVFLQALGTLPLLHGLLHVASGLVERPFRDLANALRLLLGARGQRQRGRDGKASS